MFVSTKKTMSRETPEAEGHEKLVANRLGVATQGIPVVTRTRLMHKIYVATLSKYLATQSKNKPKEQVVTEDCMLRKRLVTRTKGSIVTEFLCRNRATNLTQNFRDPQRN